MAQPLIVAISAGSGVILGIRLLELLQRLNIPTHLVISEDAKKLVAYETHWQVADVQKLATSCYANDDFFAPMASGSFRTQGMVVIPCSMKTLAGVAGGYADNLIVRAADVCLKERRRLVLVTRETPLNLIHIENMHKVTLAGGIILPPVVSFYTHPESLDNIIAHILGKVLDVLGIEHNCYRRWEGKE